MPHRSALLAVCLALPLLFLPALAAAGEADLAPERAADRILWGDAAMKADATRALAEATPDYLASFKTALAARRAAPEAAADRLIARALDGDGDAVTLLAGMGPFAIRRLLERIRNAQVHRAPPPPLPAGGAWRLPPPDIALKTPRPRDTVLVETWVLTVPTGHAAGILGDARASGVHLLDGSEFPEVLAAFEQAEAVEILAAPTVLVESHSWAEVEVAESITYIERFEVEKRGDLAVANPVISQVNEGLQCSLRPVVSADRRFVTLEGHVTQKAVGRPLPVETRHIDGLAEPVEVQVPVVSEARLELHVTIPAGGAVVGTGLTHPAHADKELVVLLRPTRMVEGDTLGVTEPGLENAGKRLLEVEARALEVTEAALVHALRGSVPDAHSPCRVLEAEEIVRLLGANRLGAAGVKILHAPRLTTFEGQQANVSVLKQVSYVQDYDEKQAEDGSTIASPVIGVIQEGLVLLVTPRLTDDRTRLRLDAEATWADLRRPIPKFQTTLASSRAPVTIHLPELTVLRVKDPCLMPPGGWVLLGGLGRGEHGRRFILLHARIVEPGTAGLDNSSQQIPDGSRQEGDITPK